MGNQHQTFRQETQGGYLWSPKRNANGVRNPFHERCEECRRKTSCSRLWTPGLPPLALPDLTAGRVRSHRSLVQPVRTGKTVGRSASTSFHSSVESGPRTTWPCLGPVLPDRYSPLELTGNGNQGVYLTKVPREVAEVLAGLIGSEATKLVRADVASPDSGEDVFQLSGEDLESWEHLIETRLETDTSARMGRRATRHMHLLRNHGSGWYLRFGVSVRVFAELQI